MWNPEEKLAEMGKAARKEFDRKYTAEVSYEILMRIYDATVTRKRQWT
jgi:hypothetical protein